MIVKKTALELKFLPGGLQNNRKNQEKTSKCKDFCFEYYLSNVHDFMSSELTKPPTHP